MNKTFKLEKDYISIYINNVIFVKVKCPVSYGVLKIFNVLKNDKLLVLNLYSSDTFFSIKKFQDKYLLTQGDNDCMELYLTELEMFNFILLIAEHTEKC